MNTLRSFALILGGVYLLAGVAGFVPGLSQPPGSEAAPLAVDAAHGRLFGLFPVNALHNLVHIAIGVWGILAWRRTTAAARGFARGLAIVYGVLTVMGLVPALNTMFGLAPLYSHDIWLHAGTALAGAYFGWVYRVAPEHEGAAGRAQAYAGEKPHWRADR